MIQMEFKQSLKEMTMMGAWREQQELKQGGLENSCTWKGMKWKSWTICYIFQLCSKLDVSREDWKFFLSSKEEEISWENKVPILSIELWKNRVAFHQLSPTFPISLLFIIKTDQTTINLGFPILFRSSFNRLRLLLFCVAILNFPPPLKWIGNFSLLCVLLRPIPPSLLLSIQ